MNVEIIKSEDYGIEPQKASEITNGLETILAEREVLKEAYLDVISLEVTPENAKEFKDLRLKIVKNRTQGIEKWHKTQKAFFLTGGRFVDAIKNKEVAINEDWEAKLLEAEKHFENIEKARLEVLQAERVGLIAPYVEDAFERDYTKFDEDEFTAILAAKKEAYEDKLEAEKLEAERIENERIAQEKAIEAQRLENIKLKADAEAKQAKADAEEKERQRLAKIEADKLAKERAENEAKQKAIQDKADAELKAEKEKAIALQAKINADLKAKEYAEKLAKSEADKLEKAPIKKQMSVWVESFELPTTTVENEVKAEIIAKFDGFKKWALTQVNNL